MRLPIDEIVGDNALRLRKRHGWSQRYLAQKADVSQRVISNLEQGGGAGSSSLKILDSVASAMGAPTFAMFIERIGVDPEHLSRLKAAIEVFSSLSDENQERVLQIMSDYKKIGTK